LSPFNIEEKTDIRVENLDTLFAADFIPDIVIFIFAILGGGRNFQAFCCVFNKNE
jgi:hypothetical protein